MTDVSALGKQPCPKCAGEMEWSAKSRALSCPYCGFVSEQQPEEDADQIPEHDLEAFLRELSNQPRGFGEASRSVKCQSCHAVSVFDADRVAQRCDFCGSPAVIAQTAEGDVITPESLLPLRLDEPSVRDAMRTWYRSRWFAPNRLKTAALTDTVRAVYLPYFTFDAQAEAAWSAEAGYYHYTTETVREGDRVRRVQRREVRWQFCSGHVSHFFDDELVPATVGVHASLLQQVEPFPTTELRAYDPAYVRGHVVERYQVDLASAAKTSLALMGTKLRHLCSAQVPGDTQRNLQVQPVFSGRTFKHVLFPVWLVSYDFHGQAYQVLVNGFTGKVAGERPLSWLKIFFYVILPILLLLAGILARQVQRSDLTGGSEHRFRYPVSVHAVEADGMSPLEPSGPGGNGGAMTQPYRSHGVTAPAGT